MTKSLIRRGLFLRVRLLFIYCSVAPCQALGQTQTRPVITISYKPQDNGTPCIPVRFNSSTNVKLIFDTGSNQCYIFDALVAKLGLVKHTATTDENAPIMLAGKQAQEVTIASMEVGIIQSPNAPFIVAPDAFAFLYEGKADGFIGTNYMEHFAFLIDEAKEKLTLWPNGALNTADLKSVGFEDAVSLPITFDKDGLYRVHVRFNDKEDEEIALDTGAAMSSISFKLVRQLKLRAIEPERPHDTLFGPVKTGLTHLQSLALGKLMLKNIDILYSNGPNTPGFFPRIGMDVLSHFRFLLDAPAKKLYLKPIETETPKAETPDAKR